MVNCNMRIKRPTLLCFMMMLLVILYNVLDGDNYALQPDEWLLVDEKDIPALTENSGDCRYKLLQLIEQEEVVMLTEHLDVFAKLKTIIVSIPKSGSTVYRYLIHSDSVLESPINLHDEVQSKRFENHQSLLIYLSQFYCNERYEKYVIIRDPLTRLLSGYLDKCTETIHGWTKLWHNHCASYLRHVGIDIFYWQSLNDTQANSDTVRDWLDILNRNNSFPKFVQWLNMEKTRSGASSIDVHFRNMHLFARLDLFIQEPNWNLLHVTNLSEWNLISRKIANVSVVDRIHTKHETHASQMVLNYYTTSQIVSIALKYTCKDYMLLNLHLPTWICKYAGSHELKSFVNTQFVHHRRLIPSCLLEL